MKAIVITLLFVLGTTPAALAQPRTSPATEPETKSGPGTSQAPDASGVRRTAPPAGAGRVQAVQQALKDKGHDPGAIDGRMGPKTTAALREFQKKEGLSPSGRLDAQTLDRLGLAKDSATASASSAGKPQKTEMKKEGPGASTTTPQAEMARDTDVAKKQKK